MQEKVYKSEEVRKKLADLLVAMNRYNDADANTVEKMLDELDVFLRCMQRQYFPALWYDIKKILGNKHGNTSEGAQQKKGINGDNV